MKFLFISLIFICCINKLNAQIKAITDEGKTVILFDNNTWKYEDEGMDNEIPKEISLSKDTAVKSPKSTFLIKSKKTNFGFWINPTKWTLTSAKTNESAEFMLRNKTTEIFALIITEEIEIELESLRKVAIDNLKENATEVVLVNEEYRIVNGNKVLHMEFNAKINGIKVTYFGYYYSNEKGTVQYVTFSSQSIMSKYKTECLILLNGLVERTL
jgi:hypothetical protein